MLRARLTARLGPQFHGRVSMMARHDVVLVVLCIAATVLALFAVVLWFTSA